MDATALLLIDLQHDFLPGGALAVPEGDAVLGPAAELARRFRHVVLTQDWHPPDHRSFASQHPGKAPFDSVDMPYGAQTLWPDHCVQGTHGAAFHPSVPAERARLIVRKGMDPGVDSYSAFRENDRQTRTGLAGFLRELGVARVVLAGLATDYCVRYSAQDAREFGFEVQVVDEAVRGLDVDGSVAATWAVLQASGCQRIRLADVRGDR